MTLIRIAGHVHDSIVDGPGLRYVVFAQGCPLACAGCHNPATQPFDKGNLVPVADLVAELDSNPLVTGLTLSGGEPTLQPEAAAMLAEAAHERGLDVWCYSGYRVERLLARSSSDHGLRRLLNSLDVLVDGPFVVSKRSLTLAWRGSRNQRLIDVPATLSAGRPIGWAPDTQTDSDERR